MLLSPSHEDAHRLAISGSRDAEIYCRDPQVLRFRAWGLRLRGLGVEGFRV